MPQPPAVLVVDDHRKVREPLAAYLRREGMHVMTAEDAAQMWTLLQHQSVDLVVLDVMLPDADGMSLCRSLRRRADLAVILLTARGEAHDRIGGLESGADDYVVKPFEPGELLARIRAVWRRVAGSRAEGPPVAATRPPRYAFADLTFDSETGELLRNDGKLVQLSTSECRLLAAFLAHAGEVLDRERLIDLTTAPGSEMFDRSIDRQVSRLRSKLGRTRYAPSPLRTVWGEGYVLSGDVALLDPE